MRDSSSCAHRLICAAVILGLLNLTVLPAAAQEAQSDPGTLVVSSTPSGLPVYLDATLIGTTPIMGYAVAAGRHTVRVVNPNSTDWDMRDWVREITVASGETASAQAVFVGIVTVMSVPFDANVYVDGDLAGTTPLRLRDLTPGLHAISIQKRGYGRVTLSVSVSDTARQTLTAELKPAGEANKPSVIQAEGNNIQRSRCIPGYITLGTGLVFSGLAFITRHRANRAYDQYQRTGDPVELERFYRQANRDDKMAGIFIELAQANFLVSFYFFLSRAFGHNGSRQITDR